MQRKPLHHASLKSVLASRLTNLCNDDGDFIYPGEGDAAGRTGSNLMALLKYIFDNSGDKLLDTDLFRSFLHTDMRIPQHLLNTKLSNKLKQYLISDFVYTELCLDRSSTRSI